MDWEKTLLDNSFVGAGNWELDGDQVILRHNFTSSSPSVYAFLLDQEVVYVGTTKDPFEKRMKGYMKPGPTQSTNKRINKNIREALKKKHEVSVLACSPGTTKWNQLEVYVAPGLETSLIESISPLWNKQR